MRDNLGKEFGYDSYDAIYKTISESFSSEDIQNAMQAIAEAKDELSQFEEAHVAHKSQFDEEFANSMLSLGTTAGDIKYWAAYIDANWVSEQEAQNKKDLNDISKKLADAEGMGADMKKEISEITENLEAARAELEQLEEESEAWSEKSDEISTLEVEFKAAVKGFSSHEIQLNEVANTKADMEKSNDDFSNKVEKAAKAHPAAVAKYTEVKDTLLSSQEEHASWLVEQNAERSAKLDEIKSLEAKAGSTDSFRSKVNIQDGEIDAELSIEAKEKEKKTEFSEYAATASVQLEEILTQKKAV
jgi:chromosome segregation ATPase